MKWLLISFNTPLSQLSTFTMFTDKFKYHNKIPLIRKLRQSTMCLNFFKSFFKIRICYKQVPRLITCSSNTSLLPPSIASCMTWRHHRYRCRHSVIVSWFRLPSLIRPSRLNIEIISLCLRWTKMDELRNQNAYKQTSFRFSIKYYSTILRVCVYVRLSF